MAKSQRSKKHANGHSLLREIVIAGPTRPPMGTFGGALSTWLAPCLGAAAARLVNVLYSLVVQHVGQRLYYLLGIDERFFG